MELYRIRETNIWHESKQVCRQNSMVATLFDENIINNIYVEELCYD